jgi:hypothetical protein
MEFGINFKGYFHVQEIYGGAILKFLVMQIGNFSNVSKVQYFGPPVKIHVEGD